MSSNVTLLVQNNSPWSTKQGSDRNLSQNQFIKFVKELQFHCPKIIRAGNKGDGGWNVCISHPFKPSPHCLVYSFGINYDYSFDTHMGRTYGCKVKSYDPSMKRGMYGRIKQGEDTVISQNVTYYKIGLGGKTHFDQRKWMIQTFDYILRVNKDENKTIDMLKIDIEQQEWQSLPKMFADNSLQNVKQLAFEMHTHYAKISNMFDVLIKLETLGFKKYLVHHNPLCNKCYELYYINTKFVS